MGRPSFGDVMDEVEELYKDKTWEELYDVVHSVGRVVCSLTRHCGLASCQTDGDEACGTYGGAMKKSPLPKD